MYLEGHLDPRSPSLTLKTRQVDWTQVAVEANYKDHKNAKVMGGRLFKKLTGASAGAAPAADGDNEDAGEGSSKTGTTVAGKKRRAPATAQEDNSPSKGEISITASGYPQHLTCCVAARPAKKPKATHAQSTAVNKVTSPRVKSEDHGKSHILPYGFHYSILTILQQATLRLKKPAKLTPPEFHLLEGGFT